MSGSYGFEYGGSPMAGGGDAGGFGGGASQGSGGAGGGGRPRKGYDEQTLIPVTIKMIKNTVSTSNQEGTGSLALTDERELHQVKFVGAIRNCDPQSTNITYEVEDGTGLIMVKQWLDDSDNSALEQMRQECQPNTYVRVIGQVKEYDGQKQVLGYSVRKVSSGNELTHHMLEVVFSAEKYKKSNQIVGLPQAQPFGSGLSSGVGFGGGGGNMAMTSSMGGGGGGGDVTNVVLDFIKEKGELLEVGADVNECIRSYAGQFSESQIRQAVEKLASEGLIYSTINEDNYKYAM
mmetsp:Transcript_37929/g.56773  ORF Transcript_37929/g.56773 Transcript_37929/m.56773 type:complete len:291 (-) Transcript_37929:95-967(-)